MDKPVKGDIKIPPWGIPPYIDGGTGTIYPGGWIDGGRPIGIDGGEWD